MGSKVDPNPIREPYGHSENMVHLDRSCIVDVLPFSVTSVTLDDVISGSTMVTPHQSKLPCP